MQSKNEIVKDSQKTSWDRQENESAKAYAAFCAYRDYGIDRSITKVLRTYNDKYGSRSLLNRWSNRFGWVKRCYAYDVFMEKERRKELYIYHLEMTKRHAEQAQLLQEKAISALQDIEPSSLSNQELLRYMEVGMKLEKDAFGYAIEGEVSYRDEEEHKQHDPIGERMFKDLRETTEKLLAMR